MRFPTIVEERTPEMDDDSDENADKSAAKKAGMEKSKAVHATATRAVNTILTAAK
jgi:hypothetical protein